MEVTSRGHSSLGEKKRMTTGENKLAKRLWWLPRTVCGGHCLGVFSQFLRRLFMEFWDVFRLFLGFFD